MCESEWAAIGGVNVDTFVSTPVFSVGHFWECVNDCCVLLFSQPLLCFCFFSCSSQQLISACSRRFLEMTQLYSSLNRVIAENVSAFRFAKILSCLSDRLWNEGGGRGAVFLATRLFSARLWSCGGTWTWLLSCEGFSNLPHAKPSVDWESFFFRCYCCCCNLNTSADVFPGLKRAQAPRRMSPRYR